MKLATASASILTVQFAAAIGLAATVAGAFAQSTTLPAPSRTVFKCSVSGKVIYSDEPCVGAQRVNVEPTRGMNKSTGHELVGPDVQRERFNESMATAMKPLTGMTPAQTAVFERRFKLEPSARVECYRLDAEISRDERSEGVANAARRTDAQLRLFKLRKRAVELRC
jgi:hypothetical protein